MKKIVTFLLICLLSMPFTGCGSQPAEEGDTLTVLLDSAVTAIAFEKDINAGIQELKSGIENGFLEDTPANRMILANTEIMRDWALEREITINCKNWGWADSLTNKLQSAFWAEETPDIINGETQLPGFAQRGYLQPFPEDLASYVRENCLSVSYSGMTFDGKIYGISLTPSVTILVWNKDMLRDCGISEEIVENGPGDWAEWEATMQTVSAQGKNAGGVYTGAGNINYGAFLRSGTLMLANGGGFADETGAPNVNSAENIEAYEFIRRMSGYNKNGMLNASSEDSYFSYFKTGNMAYYVDGAWAIHDAQYLNFDTGYCMMPSKDGEGEGATMMIGCCYLSVPIYAKNPDLAWDFLRMLLDLQIQSNVAKGGMRFPALKEANEKVYSDTESEYYRDYFPAYEELTAYAVDKDVKGLPAFAMEKGKLSTVWNAAGVMLGKLADSRNKTEVSVLAQDAQSAMIAEWNKG